MTSWIVFASLSIVLVAAMAIDIRTGKVPNALTYPAVLIGIAGWPLWGALQGGASGASEAFSHLMIAIALALLPFLLLWQMRMVGGGDLKLMVGVGALSASWACVAATALYGFLIGGIIAVIVMVRRGLVTRTMSRLFGAALMKAAGGEAELDADDQPDRQTIAYTIGFCIGGLLYAAESMGDLHTPWRALPPPWWMGG